MDLKELLKTTPWQDIAIALVTAYPNQRKLLEGYQIIFETLKLMAPKDSDLTLHVVPRVHDERVAYRFEPVATLGKLFQGVLR